MQRVQRTEAGAVTYMLYDGEKLATGKDGTWTTQQGYVSESPSIYSSLVAQSGSEHWFLFDALGTTLGITTNAGTLTDTFMYEAFGTELGRTGTTATPYQYVGGYGYWNEPNVGMEQVWWRWYGPGAGRFVSTDPIGRTVNRYAYLKNSPMRLVDPSGRQPIAASNGNPWFDTGDPGNITLNSGTTWGSEIGPGWPGIPYPPGPDFQPHSFWQYESEFWKCVGRCLASVKGGAGCAIGWAMSFGGKAKWGAGLVGILTGTVEWSAILDPVVLVSGGATALFVCEYVECGPELLNKW
jgi:RHS repeat-associated protein